MSTRIKNSLDTGRCRGRVRGMEFDPVSRLWQPRSELKTNLVVYHWGKILAPLLTQGDSKYRIAGMLLEYENTTNPGDPVSIPTYDRTRDIQYYLDLTSHPKRDYLRVSLTASQVLTAGADYENNLLVFFARTAGLQGANGKPFSADDNSKVFGAALVAMPEPGDRTQDLVLSAFYFAEADQIAKEPAKQIGLEWEIELQ